MSTETRYWKRRDEHAKKTFLYKAEFEGERLITLFNVTTGLPVERNTKMFKRAARGDSSFSKALPPPSPDDGTFVYLVGQITANDDDAPCPTSVEISGLIFVKRNHNKRHCRR